MDLPDLVAALPEARLVGTPPPAVQVNGIRYDSRQVQPGDLFVAIPGAQTDGRAFVAAALARGAVAVVTQPPAPSMPPTAPLVLVPDARQALALLAAARHGQPSHRLRLVGVTGTDGKTTTTVLIAGIFEAAGLRTGYLSTVQLKTGGLLQQNHLNYTTPQPPEIQAALAAMVRQGATTAVIEVSSHALALHRVAGCAFDVAVLTNLAPEHLNFHGSLEAYRQAKARLFEMLALSSKRVPRLGVVNADDPSAEHFIAACPAPVLTYGLGARADVCAEHISGAAHGTQFTVHTPVGSLKLHTRLVGPFNVYNWLAAIATAVGQHVPLSAVALAASTVQSVPGRLERIDCGQPFAVFVDFAHTPQALQAIARALRPLTDGRLIIVCGHAGGRDLANRSELARVAVASGDFAIFTTDDPGEEDPVRICATMAEAARGAGAHEGDQFRQVVDRAEAIAAAIDLAGPGDTVILAGRGHEQTMPVGDARVPFDDAVVARACLERLATGPGWPNPAERGPSPVVHIASGTQPPGSPPRRDSWEPDIYVLPDPAGLEVESDYA